MVIGIGNWIVDDRKISVFREGNLLKYNIFQDASSNTSILSPDLIKLYGIQRATLLIKIFQDVINKNLKDQINSQSFLPLLCTEGFVKKESDGKQSYEPINLQVALFSQFARPIPEETSRKIINACWGIYDPIGKKTSYLDVDETSDNVLTFLRNVPFRSGKEKYSEYVKRFRPILTKENDEITSIALKCISMFDPNMILDEQNWAITVISAGHRSGLQSVGFAPNLGHSMIAIEGMKNTQLFLKYAHITTRQIPGFDDDRKKNEARVEIITNKVLKDITPGITWIRPKAEVSKMLQYIENEQNNKCYVNFSMAGSLIGSIKKISAIFAPIIIPSSFMMVFPVVTAITMPIGLFLAFPSITEHNFSYDYNCSSWVIEILLKARIELFVPKVFDAIKYGKLLSLRYIISPKQLVKSINSGKMIILKKEGEGGSLLPLSSIF